MTHGPKLALVAALLLVLCVLAALARSRGRGCVGAAAAVGGGLAAALWRGGAGGPGPPPEQPPREQPPREQPADGTPASRPPARERGPSVGAALGAYARALGPGDAVGAHPLESEGYTAAGAPPGARQGGAARAAPRKPWTAHATWADLRRDEGALAAYMGQRAAVLNNPALDWGPVLEEMLPRLQEAREYIGVASLDADGHTVRVTASEASPQVIGEGGSETTFAGVPGELVAKYAEKPGLFLFHTHPADPRGCPLPSSHDLAATIYFSATARFAAGAVISRYGVLAYGLDWPAYKAINAAADWRLAALNLSSDVVAAHESMRSWAPYTLDDYRAFYPRYHLLFFAFPSAEMIGDTRRFKYSWGLESPVDSELLGDLAREVAEHRAARKKAARPPGGKAATFAVEPAAEAALTAFD